ncbi:MAG: metal ABC transporter ATP-binding protein [Clostridia bacterium]|nr:metal ABC transporter ATP-binding protein [Clostridia bacterium]
MKTLIEVENLSVAFEGNAVFKNLNFKINEGDYLCIAGENGSGKTTLMKCILGLDVKYSGAIKYGGITKNSIGWLPQRSETKRDFPASVFEIVLSGFAGKKETGLFYSSKQKKQALNYMETMEISGLKNRCFSSLSGGQQQRVLLCRALCAADRVLLLDEPVTGLDSSAVNELYTAIQRLNKSGITVIMITHDICSGLKYANKVLHISEGGYFFGEKSEYILTEYYKKAQGGI